MWQLKGKGVVSHQPQPEEKGTQMLKLQLSASVLKNIRTPSTPYKVKRYSTGIAEYSGPYLGFLS